MDVQDLRTLRILEEIEKNQLSSQRELSRKLNVSLGLINLFIKRLASKGYLKISTIPKNRIKYVLTPKGIAEKSKLTAKHLHHSFKFYRDTRSRIRSLLDALSKREVNTIVLFGATELAEMACILLKETRIELIGIVDSNKHGESFCGEAVFHPSTLSDLVFDKVLITILEPGHDWIAYLIQMGVSKEKLETIY
jgi:DNA-binding MarR family transcriptional regulator